MSEPTKLARLIQAATCWQALAAVILADAAVKERDDSMIDIEVNLAGELERARLPWTADEVLTFSPAWHAAGYGGAP
jgi:hypothetical protein